MSYDIGTARGVIEMEYNGRGVTQAEADLKGLEKGSDRTSRSLNKASNVAGGAGLAIAAGLGVAVNAATNFEQRMSAVEAVSGATASEMDALSDKALQLGKDTAFSATESAQAIEELVKAGLSVEDVLNGAADATVALAAAGEIALPEAATIASNAMNQFGLSAKQLPKVADILAGAANASAIDVSDLGQSMQQAGAVANLAGVDFEDLTTAIAVMGNAGIKGSDAGTSLKSMLMRLQPTTQAQINEMRRLGIITYDTNTAMKILEENGIKGVANNADSTGEALKQLAADMVGADVGSAKAEKQFQKLGLQTGFLSNKFYDAQGNTRSLAEISGVLGKSLEGMNKRQKQAALQVLFGSDAIRAAAIMAGKGKKGFDEMNASLNKTTAAEVAATRMDNLKGRLEELKGSAETMGIAIGTVLLPVVEKIVAVLTKAANWFLSLSDAQQKWIAIIIASVSAILLIVAGIMKIIIFIGKFKAALVALKGTMIATWAAALGPILLWVAAIALVVAAIVLLWKKSETFRNAVLAVWNAIKAAAAAVAAWFTGTFVPALGAVWSAIQTAVSTAWNFIIGVIRGVLSIIVTVIKTWFSIVTAPWRAGWALFGPIVKAAFGLIVAIIRLAWTIIKGVTILGVKTVKAAVTAGFNAVKSVTSSVWNAIKAVIMAVWGVIGPYVKAAAAAIKAAITVAWNAVKSVTSSVWNSLKGVISTAVAGIMGVVNGIKGQVLAAFDFAGEMFAKGQAIIQGIIDGITSMIGKVTDVINGIADKVGKFWPGSPVKEGPLRKLNRGKAGKEIVQMVIDGIVSMERPLDDALAVALPTLSPRTGLGSDTGKGGTVRRAQPTGPRQVRLDGELQLVNGRAYISGIAEDVFDNFAGNN